VLYLYAFAQQPTIVPDVAGIAGSALDTEDIDGLAAVVSALEGRNVSASEEAVLAHARVVDELVSVNDAVVPARFGRAYADADSLRRAASTRLPRLREALDRVRGCVELGLRVLPPSADAMEQPTSGRQYMLERLEERRRLERLADEVHAPLAGLAKAATGVQASARLVSAAYLVPRSGVEAFRDAVRALEQRHPDATLVCTGPWPPYSFVTADPEPA
jgi:glycosyltransferase involved in cell wall biosynthesis